MHIEVTKEWLALVLVTSAGPAFNVQQGITLFTQWDKE